MICKMCKKDLPASRFGLKRGNNKLKAEICRDCADKCAFSAEDEILLNEYSRKITKRNKAYVLQRI